MAEDCGTGERRGRQEVRKKIFSNFSILCYTYSDYKFLEEILLEGKNLCVELLVM